MVYDRYKNLYFNAGFDHKAPESDSMPSSFMTQDVLKSKALSKRRAKNKMAQKARRLNKKRRRGK